MFSCLSGLGCDGIQLTKQLSRPPFQPHLIGLSGLTQYIIPLLWSRSAQWSSPSWSSTARLLGVITVIVPSKILLDTKDAWLSSKAQTGNAYYWAEGILPVTLGGFPLDIV